LGKILVAILTASDKGSRGEREDRSAQVIRELVAGIDGEVVAYDVVPDERKVLAEKLVQSSPGEIPLWPSAWLLS
jgi:molybdopterin adenylyltransferase